MSNLVDQFRDILYIPGDSFLLISYLIAFMIVDNSFLQGFSDVEYNSLFLFDVTSSMIKSEYSMIPEWLRDYDDSVLCTEGLI